MSRPALPAESKHSDETWEELTKQLIDEESEFLDAIQEYRNAVRIGVNSKKASEFLVSKIDYLLERCEDRAHEELEGKDWG